MPFQLNSQKLFLTYAEVNDWSTQEVYDFLHDLLEIPIKLLVAKELHKNGHTHFHVFAELQRPIRTRDKRFADLNGPEKSSHHGNYQGARNAKNVLKYCTKDGDFVSNFNVEELLPKSTSSTKVFGQRIMAGEDFMQVIQDFPQFIKGYQRLKTDVEAYIKDVEERKVDRSLPSEVPNPWDQRFFVDTDVKRCHFWFYSAQPNKGKTSGVIEPLIRHHHAYLFNPKSTYHEVRKGTKIICIDEFSIGQMKAQSLNTLCDGFYKFRIFMGGEITLDEKPLVIICSNYSINEVFPFMNNLVHARFNEYDVSQF